MLGQCTNATGFAYTTSRQVPIANNDLITAKSNIVFDWADGFSVAAAAVSTFRGAHARQKRRFVADS